jgi:predicted nucleic acid-binding protein
MDPILIDTNLLVYTFDKRDLDKQQKSEFVVGTLAQASIGCLSAQCLSEFFNVVSRSMSTGNPILSIDEAVLETERLSRAFAVFPVTQQVVREALRGVKEHQLQFWDAQVWACARLNQIPIIFSEDFRSGESIEGVRFVNPLVENFQLKDWISG